MGLPRQVHKLAEVYPTIFLRRKLFYQMIHTGTQILADPVSWVRKAFFSYVPSSEPRFLFKVCVALHNSGKVNHVGCFYHGCCRRGWAVFLSNEIPGEVCLRAFRKNSFSSRKRYFTLFSHRLFPCVHRMLGVMAAVLPSWQKLAKRWFPRRMKQRKGGAWVFSAVAGPADQPVLELFLWDLINPLLCKPFWGWVFCTLEQQTF